MHRAFIALGSNLGDRIGTLEKAIREMAFRGFHVKRVSSVYETAPMYKTDQPSFLNAVCEIEEFCGRVRLEENGPRTLDLDILLFDNRIIAENRLLVPHKLMLEREFVLRPLCDLVPETRLPPPYDPRSFRSYLRGLEKEKSEAEHMESITHLSSRLPYYRNSDPSRSTLIMAILNLTPDSFSDGGLHNPNDLAQVEDTVRAAVAGGARIIDIGGQSTRPGAQLISSSTEIHRVLPAIKHLRKTREFDDVAISIDTFYAPVAKAAVNAGADIINDVTAGRFDPSMFSTAAALNTPLILMHSRGNPSNMNTLAQYLQGVVAEVLDELAESVRLAKESGVLPWHIILDPGIGFAKDQSQNLEIISNFGKLRCDERLRQFPWLVGSSRKGFIGKITGAKSADGRAWGTAATVTACIQGGADIIRVHDVAEMSQVAKMADAMYRKK
ncbi:MAG: hypothetical protein Q9227_008589 [Pyrenula ochraceoflavens]